jgi:hypothetical protein
VSAQVWLADIGRDFAGMKCGTHGSRRVVRRHARPWSPGWPRRICWLRLR